MERLCPLSPAELDLLASESGLELDDAVYPPPCDPQRGRLTLRHHERGGILLTVEPREIPLADFVLAMLFGTGSCIFGRSEDLARFLRETVAPALGVECEPLPTPPAASTEPDEPAPEADPEPDSDPEPVAVQPPARKRRRKPASRHAPRPDVLAAALARSVHGQEVAVGQVARAVCTHLAKRSPARPESLLFVGPTGTGKTSTVEALPDALEELGFSSAHVFRVDCGELVCWSDLRRILGAPPSFVGYVGRPPLVDALGKPGCILLLDEIEKAHSSVHDVFLGLLDTGRLTAPDGETIEASRAVVVMTTNLGADDLAYRLRELPPGSRVEQRVCREHLLREGWPPELVGRIGTVAVFDELSRDSRRGVAERAIHSLAGEFGLTVEDLPGVLIDVVCDIADASEIGARAYTYAARDLLVDAFADAAREGLLATRVAVDPGPPPRVVQTSPS